ncbi:MAG: hypothetical protein K2X99_03930 [Gemmatimonadaceae bacterium]|nr:hypothetical protein [Gemmatimonadaceae bacterium]
MFRRQFLSTSFAAMAAVVAVVGACRDSATTGPASVASKEFAAGVRLVSGDAQTASVVTPLPQPISVKVVDAGGNPVVGATVTFQVRAGGGSVNPAGGVSSSSGLVTTVWTLGNTLGANKVVALLSNNYAVDSVAFNATAKAGAAKTLSIVSGDAQTKAAGQTLDAPLVVKVVDQFGFAVSGVTVTFTPATNNGSATPSTAVTDTMAGQAQTNWRLANFAIPHTLTASAPGVTSVQFTATARVDTGRVVTPFAGASQTAPVGGTLATPLQVQVVDNLGNPVAGDTIFWNDSIGAGGRATSLVSVTDANGRAATSWVLGPVVGTQTLRARNRTNKKATFTATATMTYSQVFAGNYFACALGTDDRSYCWGYGEDGQLGKGVARSANGPTAAVSTAGDSLLGPFLTFRSLSAGRLSTCGVTVSRSMFCWGRIHGATQSNSPTQQTFTPPTTVSLTAVGERHTCMTTPTGIPYCTGTNDEGQLGNGTNTSSTIYVAVGTGAAMTTIAAGSLHSCGMLRLDLAVPSTKLPRCWGFSSSGQLGNNSTGVTLSPVTLSTVGAMVGVTGIDSTSLVSGALHSCAIVNESVSVTIPVGSTICWGSNGYGQLGRGTTIARDSIAGLVTGGLTFVSLSAGEFHTCGVTATGAAHCWGRNSSGQLGNGSTTDANAPVAVAGGLSWRQLALGELFSCGIASPSGSVGGTTSGAGVLYCWGDNEYGQAGQGTNSANSAPITTPAKVRGQP